MLTGQAMLVNSAEWKAVISVLFFVASLRPSKGF
jgi:hypothetical protein